MTWEDGVAVSGDCRAIGCQKNGRGRCVKPCGTHFGSCSEDVLKRESVAFATVLHSLPCGHLAHVYAR